MESVLTAMPAIKLTQLLNTDEEITEEENYSMWFQEGTEFVPSINLKTVDTIPSGVYKIQWKRDDWRVAPVPLNTDELYSFENDITSKMLEEVQAFWDKKEIYEKYKLTHKRGLLLVGSPGTGKTGIITMLTSQIVKNNGLVFIATNAQEFMNLSESLNSVVRKIEPDRPVITILEDIDQTISSLNGDSQVLDFLDGKTSINHHLCIMTSNDTTDLSEALLRPSRIDMCVEVPEPSENVRREYFLKKGVSEESIEEFTEKSEGYTFAEMKELFIGTQILGKNIDKVIDQIDNPYECKDYLSKNNEMKGID